MDRPLADGAQRHRAGALLAIGIGVLEVGERTVDRIDAGGTAGHDQAEAGIVPDVARIALGLADILVVHAHRGREVAHAEHQALEPRRRLGDGIDVLHALDFLDQRLEADAALELQLLLELMQQLVGEQHVGRRQHLGHHDRVEMLAGTFDHFDDVLEGVLGGEVVDAHAARLARPVERLQALDDLLAGIALLAGSDGVFEVEEDVIGLRLRRLLDHLLAGAGRRKLDAAGAAGLTVGHSVLLRQRSCRRAGGRCRLRCNRSIPDTRRYARPARGRDGARAPGFPSS